MKKIFKLLFLLLTITILLGISDFKLFNVSAASEPNLSQEIAEIKKGEDFTLTLRNASSKVTWSVSKKKIVELTTQGNTARVSGKKAGTVYVTAECNGKTYKCKVIVDGGKKKSAEIDYTLYFYDPKQVSYIIRDGKYIGAVDKNNIPNGEGKFYCENVYGISYVFSGNFVDGKMDGKCVCKWDSGLKEVAYYDKGTFIKATYDDEDGKTSYYLNEDGRLNKIYLGEYSSHFAADGEKEPFTTADIVFAHIDNWQDSYKGLEFPLKSLIAINSYMLLSNKEIKAKAKAVETKKITRSVDSYIKKIVSVKKAEVFQAYELSVDKSWGIKKLTKVLFEYEDHVYIVYINGSVDAYEDDKIDCYFTPIANISYESTTGNTVKATTGIAYIIERR